METSSFLNQLYQGWGKKKTFTNCDKRFCAESEALYVQKNPEISLKLEGGQVDIAVRIYAEETEREK